MTDIAHSAKALERACRSGATAAALAALAAPIDASLRALAASLPKVAESAGAPEPCCEIPAMSAAQAAAVQGLATRLLTLLDGGDAQALDAAEELAAAVHSDSDLGRSLAELSRRIQTFEFTAAATDLRALREPIGRLGTAAAAAEALMGRLALLLDDDDTGAEAVAAELVGVLREYPRLAEQAQQVAHWIDEFDYTAARTALTDLRQQQAREVEVDDGTTDRADR